MKYVGRTSYITKLKLKPERGAQLAFCSSQKCLRAQYHIARGKYFKDSLKAVLKEVSPGTLNCPDCGYVIVWERGL